MTKIYTLGICVHVCVPITPRIALLPLYTHDSQERTMKEYCMDKAQVGFPSPLASQSPQEVVLQGKAGVLAQGSATRREIMQLTCSTLCR